MARLLLLSCLLLAACSTPPADVAVDEEPRPPRTGSTSHGPSLFVDVTEESGVDFVHVNGRSGQLYYGEMMGAGAALFDYDRDGDLDLYLVQGHDLDPTSAPPERPPVDRLFRNDSRIGPDGARLLRFADVTAESGLLAAGYGMGVATGDVDGDGWIDLYVTNLGPNELWRNRGDGTFAEIAARAGVEEPRWSVPAVFFDYDRDDDVDLFVGNYLDWSVATNKRCTTELGTPNYCGPLAFAPEADRLWRNRGDGRFDDVTGPAGLGGVEAGALGAVASDLDGDGWLDLYVGNDGLANHLWINQRDGSFRDEALLAGTALNDQGRAEASMGVDVADIDRDGDDDLVLAHLGLETNTVYVNDGHGVFLDRSDLTGLGGPSWRHTAFGTVWLDFDRDGWLDLLVANGAVRIIDALAVAGDDFPLHEPNQLFRNAGAGHFEEVTERAGPAFQLSEVSRGVAVGDLDDDGDLDAIVTANGGPARILLNQAADDASWIGLDLRDEEGRRTLVGARVGLRHPDGTTVWHRSRTDGSYASARDPRVLLGLGAEPASTVGPLVVEWPDGTREEHGPVPTRRYTELRRGGGRRLGAP